MRWTLLLLAGVLLGTRVARAQPTAVLPLMPLPAKLQLGDGRFVLDRSFAIEVRGGEDPRLQHAVERFRQAVARRAHDVGGAQAGKANFIVTCAGDGEKVQKMGEDESYRLEISAAEVHLDAANPLGIIRGLQTFLQLVAASPDGSSAPAAVVEDRPRFPWRGLLIDVS